MVLLATSRCYQRLWELAECARYCILTRLRTPMGKPAQTLEMFERTVQKMAGISGPLSGIQ